MRHCAGQGCAGAARRLHLRSSILYYLSTASSPLDHSLLCLPTTSTCDDDIRYKADCSLLFYREFVSNTKIIIVKSLLKIPHHNRLLAIGTISYSYTACVTVCYTITNSYSSTPRLITERRSKTLLGFSTKIMSDCRISVR